MFDTRARALLAPSIDAVALKLAVRHVHPHALTGIGWVMGVGACVAAGFRWWTFALVLWLANRLFDGLDGAVARHRVPTDVGGFLDVVSDFSIYGGFVVAVGVAEPNVRVVALVLFLTYYVSGTAFLTLSSLIERRRITFGDERSLRFVGGLAEGAETIIAYVLFCLFPGQVQWLMGVFAVMVGITAIQRIYAGVFMLRAPTTPSLLQDV